MNEIIVQAKDFGIEPEKENELMGNLPQIKSERTILETQFSEIIKMDIESEKTSKLARDLRLKIKDNRTKGIEVWHKTTKNFFLRGGQFVDAVKNKEIAVNERMEESLLEIEKHFENIEKGRIETLQNERLSVLKEYVEDTTGLNFGTMDNDVWDAYFTTKKNQYDAKVAAEKQAEIDRIAKEKADQEEREKQRLENIRLKAEAEKRELEIKKEKERLAKIEAEKLAIRNKRNSELRPYIVFIRDYNSILELSESAYQKELSGIKIGAEQQWQSEIDERNKKALEYEKRESELRTQRAKAKLLEEELNRKKDEEAKLLKQQREDEETELLEAERLAKAPVKEVMNRWVDSFIISGIGTEKMNDEQILLCKNIINKFSSFKAWAKSEIEKL